MPHISRFFENSSRQVCKNKKRKTATRNVFVWIGILLGIYFCGLVIVGLEIFVSVTDATQALAQAKTQVLEFNFGGADQSLDEAQTAFVRANRLFPFMQTVRFLPWFKDYVQQANDLIFAGKNVTDSLKSIVEIGKNIVQISGLTSSTLTDTTGIVSPQVKFSDLSSETKHLLLIRLQNAAQSFSILSNRISVMNAELSTTFAQNKNSFLAPVFERASENLLKSESALARVSVFANLIPVFAGVKKTDHHLLLFLNNTELRPAGGFIGNYGVLTVSNGDIQSIKSADVYALDRLVSVEKNVAMKIKEPAPYPLQRYNATPVWFFRDANWSPDFNESAQKIISKFYEETSVLSPSERLKIPYADSFDGVIAFTPTFVSELLRVTGPVTANGQTFTQENMAEKLEYQVEYGYAKKGIPEAQRKEIVGELVNVVMEKLTSIPFSEWSRVATVFETAFRERQLFVYHTNLTTEKILTQVGWSGRYIPSTPDVQMVVDANLASLKTDPAINRNISYELFQNSQKEYIGRTTITYKHNGTFDWKTSRYRTYTRLYVPKGSELINVDGSLKDDRTKNPNNDPGVFDVSEELGMAVFGTFTSVEPGETRSLVFEYKISDAVAQAIAQNTYALTVFKQNGSANYQLTLDLDFGKNVLHATPPENSNQWGDDHYRLNTKLDQDKKIEVGL